MHPRFPTLSTLAVTTFAALFAACTSDSTVIVPDEDGGPLVVPRDVGVDRGLDVGGDAARPDGTAADAGRDATAGDTGDATPAPDAAPDAPMEAAVPRCGAGIDSDGDGLTNAEECALMTDPFVADTDRDGVLDGQETRYPRACVAASSGAQRRPAVRCTMDADCRAGEMCRGLDPRARDSDGDGVDDGVEDRDANGTIDAAHGETDPRIADTDGDGRGDAMSDVEICRPTGLATVTQLGLPGAEVQVGHDPRWSAVRRAPGTMTRSGVVLDDAAAGVAGAVFNVPSMGDTRTDYSRAETIVRAGLGAGVSPVLVGRSFTTHEMNEAITSTFRVARATSASALRDAVAAPMLGAAAPAGAAVGASGEFLVDLTVVRRSMGTLGRNTADVLVTVAPRALYEDNTRPAAIRAIDLVNTTASAELDKGLGSHCQVIRAARTPAADFLWTVDTSGSMNDDQERLGRTATAFFNRLRSAGVDFRVGVVTAGSGTLNLDSPGFTWIPGTSAAGAATLCEQVTVGRCPTSASDSLRPYPFSGDEQPTAAAVIAHNMFVQRAMRGEANPNRRFRDGALVVTFHVTDEPGTNDFRWFTSSSAPDTGARWGATYNLATQNNIVAYFRRNNILTFGLVPVSATACSSAPVADLPRCVIEGNRGASIPIATATDAEISAAMTRIVEAIAGATSPFILERTPITSTIKVRVRGVDVPRSRDQGFDYDQASRAVVFYGDRYRPAMGADVVISYRVWQPCPTPGATCRSDNDCCAPTTCRDGRCQPPCRPLDAMCTTDADCCSPNACMMGVCRPRPMCIQMGNACTPSETANDCCPPLLCVNGTCGQCRAQDETCTRASDCCGGAPCVMGRCACIPTAGRCTTPRDCCSRYCVDGFCGPG